MSEELNTPANNSNWFWESTKKALPTIIFGVLAAIGSSYYTSRENQKDLSNNIAALKLDVVKNTENISKNAENYSQLIIAFTKVSENQIRMAQDIQGIQDRERKRLEAQAARR